MTIIDRCTTALVLALVAGQTFAQAAPLPFQTAPVEYHTVAKEYRVDGVVEAVNQSTVSAQTAGRVREVLFDVNDFVAAGSVIARLVDREQRAGLSEAEAALQEAEARSAETEADYQRMREVFARKVVSQAAMDAAQAERAAARARLDAARAGVARAREQLGRTTIKAPFSGIVRARLVEFGELVTPGQPVMSGLSLDELRVQVQISQRMVSAVREHAQARIFTDTGPPAGWLAEALIVYPYANPGTNSFPTRITLPRDVANLYPGMFVKVAFAVGYEQKLLARRQALVYRSEVTGVYVIDEEGRVAFRQVRVGRATDGSVEILAGLEAGERIALDPIRAGILLKQQRRDRDL